MPGLAPLCEAWPRPTALLLGGGGTPSSALKNALPRPQGATPHLRPRSRASHPGSHRRARAMAMRPAHGQQRRAAALSAARGARTGGPGCELRTALRGRRWKAGWTVGMGTTDAPCFSSLSPKRRGGALPRHVAAQLSSRPIPRGQCKTHPLLPPLLWRPSPGTEGRPDTARLRDPALAPRPHYKPRRRED